MPDVTADQFLLAHLNGARPAAPAWFERAVAQVPERSTLAFEGATLEVLSWGSVGKPGLLLLHGGMAHADWWSFIAPFFAATHRVVAFSWSGMGGSTWRERYATDQYVRELMAVGAATGLFDGPVKPAILAHSFGGFPTMATAALHGDRFAGVIILDAPVETPEQVAARVAKRTAEKPPKPKRIHPTEASALSRFRFSPAQDCRELYIVDWIARHSLRRAKDPQTGAEGYTWKFDPYLWSRLKRRDGFADLRAAKTRVAMVWGAVSPLFPPDTVAYCRATAPKGTLFAEIPEAAHHVMADQPLALVATTQAILSAFGH
jgi:pimeloyl-ACP methyl ester carboxylesterase